MIVELLEEYDILEDGSSYAVPQYAVQKGAGLVKAEKDMYIHFVRGSSLIGEEVTPRTGTLHEHLIAVLIHDLSVKNGLVTSSDTGEAIQKLKEALHWLRARKIDRVKRDVLGSYRT
jgi:uncharacterized phosphosugar-binding protein